MATRVGGSRAALAGLVFGVVYIVGFIALNRIPGPDASEQRLESFYGSGTDRRVIVIVAAYLVPLGGIALLWFTAAVRHRVVAMAGAEDALLSTVQLLSAAVYVTLLFAATAVITTPAIAVDSGAVAVDSLASTRPLVVTADTLLVVFAVRAAGVFIAAGTTRALRSGLIPRWFAIISYVLVVVLLFTIARARIVSLLFPIWVGIMSVIVLVRRGADQVVSAA
jgi:hypothetical protein